MADNKKLDRKLYDAVKKNNTKMVSELLSQGGNPRANVGKKGMTALDRAAQSSNKELAQLLGTQATLTENNVGDTQGLETQGQTSVTSAIETPDVANQAGENQADEIVQQQRDYLEPTPLPMPLSRLATAATDSFKKNRSKQAVAEEAAASKGQEAPEIPAVPRQRTTTEANATKIWEFDRKKLLQGGKLGEGNFGVVYAGVATGILIHGIDTKVAIKMLAETDSEEVESDFFKEVDIMKSIDGPYKIVRLLGVCTQERPYLMLMELMGKGDLKTVLRDARAEGGDATEFSIERLARMGADIAEGMTYLASQKIVHRDLAARNCLVDDDLTVKIGDFGLTRDVYQGEYYRMTGSAPLPIRWMAPECLADGLYSSSSDVWSFGVVLWELVTFAKLPYGFWSNQEVCEKVTEENYHLPAPKGCPPALYELMEQCWNPKPSLRIQFSQLANKLTTLVPLLGLEAKRSMRPSSFSASALPPAQREDDEEETQRPGPSSKGFTSASQPPTRYGSPTSFDTRPVSKLDNPTKAGPVGKAVSVDALSSKKPGASDPKSAYAPASADKKPKYGGATSWSTTAKTQKELDAEAKKAKAEAKQAEYTKRVTSGENDALYRADRAALANDTSVIAQRTKAISSQSADEMAVELQRWIESTLGRKMEGSFSEFLKSGEVLCELVNTLRPSTPWPYHKGSRMAFKQMENIGWFLERISKDFGVAGSDLFMTVDLFEESNMKQVVICLNALRIRAPRVS